MFSDVLPGSASNHLIPPGVELPFCGVIADLIARSFIFIINRPGYHLFIWNLHKSESRALNQQTSINI